MGLFKRGKRKNALKPLTILGVTMGWEFRPTLCFTDGYVLPRSVVSWQYARYFTRGDWPTDPESGEKLPMVSTPWPTEAWVSKAIKRDTIHTPVVHRKGAHSHA